MSIQDTQNLLITFCDMAQEIDDLEYIGATETRLNEIISDAKKLIALAESIKADLHAKDGVK